MPYFKFTYQFNLRLMTWDQKHGNPKSENNVKDSQIKAQDAPSPRAPQHAQRKLCKNPNPYISND